MQVFMQDPHFMHSTAKFANETEINTYIHIYNYSTYTTLRNGVSRRFKGGKEKQDGKEERKGRRGTGEEA